MSGGSAGDSIDADTKFQRRNKATHNIWAALLSAGGAIKADDGETRSSLAILRILAYSLNLTLIRELKKLAIGISLTYLEDKTGPPLFYRQTLGVELTLASHEHG